MPPASWTRLVALLAGGVLVGALVAAVVVQRPATAAATVEAWALEADGTSATQPAKLARLAASATHGGPTTTSTGETVDVQVSDSLPADAASPLRWAELVTSLPHGSEVSQLEMYVETLDEVQSVCGTDALGCYGDNQLIVPGEMTPGDVSPEEIVRHEYGHHIAFHRTNPPWDASDWGPKRWASAENICALVSRKEAYPGDEGANYTRNPGEAWAETYRLLAERTAGITTASWPIVSTSFFPSDPVLQAAQQDVLHPWTRARTISATHVFGKRVGVWWTSVTTPLDGAVTLGATVPAGGAFDVALVSANRKTVLGHAQWTGQRSKRLQSTVCGQRTLFVRVTSKGAPGRVRISATAP
jgi:hypothetical protein